jgi:adenine-specific DNA-methyltransferase
MERLHSENRIFYTENGIARYKRFLDEMEGVPLQTLWDDIQPNVSWSDDATGYDTQKPPLLLDRIISASTAAGALVADFFCGSGTTGAVAEKLGRRWIMSDLGKVGVQVTRARLVQQDSRPFLIENLGNYQREMIYLTGGRIGEMQRIILKLYGATPHPNYKDLGSRKADDGIVELVYVGYPDRPTTAKKVEELARSAETLDGNGYKRLIVLAWDYDYNYDEAWESRLAASKRPIKVDVQKRVIPPDVYDYLRKAKNEADIEKLADKIQFHEKPYLKLAKPQIGAKSEDPLTGSEQGKREITIGIERYVLFDLPVPEKDREKLSELVKENFAVLIDYWAVDWNYDGTTFKSQWQAIRGNGKKAKIVPTTLTEKLETGRTYTIAVRVVDVFGNDAAGTVVVQT